jgi:mannose-6-phosphate isomerase-like protein (cupin superfamily)
MDNSATRRRFLRNAPLAAASLALADRLLAQTPVALAQTAAPEAAIAPVPFQHFTAAELDADGKALAAKGGNKNLVDVGPGLACAVVLTTEIAKSAKEFEWHEGRDHVLVILDGTTVYELGGAPVNPRLTKPGEHLAPDSTGATRLTLAKGDLLTIPRGTPHRRSTEGSVTFYLFSPSGNIKA